jgi:hypothetical protein
LGSLAERLTTPPIIQPTRERSAHPKGWEPGIRFDADQVPVEITTPAIPQVADGDWAAALASMNFDLPEGYELRLTNASFDPFAWTRDSPDQKQAVTKAAWRYKFAVVVTADQITAVNAATILSDLKRTPKPRTQFTGESAFVVNFNDTQTGKDAGTGSEGLYERLDNYFDLAVDRAKELGKRNLGEMVLLLGGDLVEGCDIFQNQEFQIDLDRRSQIRNTTVILLDLLDRLAPHFPKVRVLAVGGNHGEHRRKGKRVNRHDNDDQLVAEGAAMAAARDPKLSHVAFTIADEQPSLTMDIQGHVLALTHGNVYAKGQGNTPDLKAYNYFKNMAAARHPVGDATIMVGNHYHHDLVKNWGNLLFVQNPAMDGGSPEFAEYSGTDCPPGMTTWVMNAESKFRDYQVLR